MKGVYEEPNFQGKDGQILVKYSQLIGICSTDTSVASPEIYEGTAQVRISFISFIPPRQRWAPDAHLHPS